MGRKMQNAPVYFALAQIRFNAVLALEQYLVLIQDNLRKAGYPDFQKSYIAAINVNIGAGPGQPMPTVQPQSQYQFLNEKRTAGFVLDQSNITYQTTEYDVFESFSAEFFKGVNVVHTAADLNYSERVGIRFLDAVCPSPSETISQYLVASVLGMADQLAPRDLVHTMSDTRTQFEKTTLVSRVTTLKQREQEGNAAYPPEFGLVNIKLMDKFSKISGIYAVIDTDCWQEERAKFDVGGLEQTLKSLHDETDRSFSLMVTPYALNVWK